MSNFFKSNSRFSALVDDIPQQKNNSKKDKEQKKELENKEEKFNSFKSERPLRRESGFRYFDEKQRDHYRLEREAEIKLEKELEEKAKQELLKIENFPDLIMSASKNDSTEISKISYIQKLKKQDIVKKDTDSDLENLKPGWLLFKSDPLTRRTIIKSHPETNIIEKNKEKNKNKNKNELGMDIINALVKLHEKRTEEYIENYGYEEWERFFKFPDWREREAYLEEMENQTDDSEYEYENDEYENEEYDN